MMGSVTPNLTKHPAADRPAETRISLWVASIALIRRIPRPQRKTVEQHQKAQARREAHRRHVHTLWIKHRRQVDDLWVNRQIY